MKYRKKPVVIEAWEFTWESVLSSSPKEKQIPPEIALNPKIKIHLTDKIENSQYAEIDTLEGTMVANAGDFIIRGVNGEFYPCKPDIFEKTYELAE
ncbi:hypothetical protein [Caproiciproducens sp.]|uniref:hypothetical protein n=1 Tax=Caproiciproducens sp. TaxID=1954376 RepID=UPI00289E4291|nr:hypothetical protein [Caproiciproducens sp.]